MSLCINNNIVGPGARPQEYSQKELFLIDSGKVYVLSKSQNWTFLLHEFIFFTFFLAQIFFLEFSLLWFFLPHPPNHLSNVPSLSLFNTLTGCQWYSNSFWVKQETSRGICGNRKYSKILSEKDLREREHISILYNLSHNLPNGFKKHFSLCLSN